MRNKLCRSLRASRKIVIRLSPNFGTSASCHTLSKPPKPDDLYQGDQSQHVRVHRLEDKCHRHDNRLTEEYRGMKYNTREHPTGMDPTPVKVS
ncbi:hypothetical protein PIB30_089733 [Stylosanthes scabra]|uniref:Uncharacterized protein n=1 Tax=Stylosanthes scabra TaxID=79078 RepID=A0ABU6QVG7_9FABA|nr:hypothetical protein [Stylosanthes scabra]